MEASVQKIQKTIIMMECIHLERRLNRVKSKLSSKEGASITYALLLFLVCATVSSVILAAGTAASGRISQSVENDRRYYAVTSAARILKDEVERWELRFDQTDRGETKGTPRLERFRERNETTWHKYPEDLGTDDHIIITAAAAELYMINNSSLPREMPSISFSIKDSDSDEETFSIMNVDLNGTVDSNGSITFDIKNPADDNPSNSNEESGVYIMTLIFAPTIKTSEHVTVEIENNAEIEVKNIKTQISWSLVSMGSG